MFLDNPALPKPPTDEEKYSYVKPQPLGLSISTAVVAIAFGWGSFLFLNNKPPYLQVYGVFVILVSLGLLWSALLYLLAKPLDIEWWEYKKKWTYQDLEKYPSVAVFLPSCGEDLALLNQCFYYISKIDYPNYKVYSLDDSNRSTVKSMANRYGFEYIAREDGSWKKSGNLRNAFAQTNEELILILDADFAPHSSIIKEMAWTFYDDPDLGLLQTPHFFRPEKRQNILERGANQIQLVFWKVIQNSRDKIGRGSAICCGSNSMFRRASIEPHGGTALANRSEDVCSGLLVVSTTAPSGNKYKLRYLPLCLATGLSPNTLSSYVNMLNRWVSGCYQVRFSKRLFNRRVPLSIKFAYMGSAVSFLICGLGVVGFAIPSLVNVMFYPEYLKWENYLIILPAIFLLVFIRARWSVGLWDSSLFFVTFITGYIAFSSTIAFLKGDMAPWVATGQKRVKGAAHAQFMFFIRWIPQLGLGFILAGIYKNWNLIDNYAFIPALLIWIIKFWTSRAVLKMDESERLVNLSLQAVEERDLELSVKNQFRT